MIGALKFGVFIDRDRDGNYISSVVELPGCHAKAKSIDAVMNKLLDAIDMYLDVENHDNKPLYELVDIKVIDVPKKKIGLATFM